MSTTAPINVSNNPKRKAKTALLTALACFALAVACTLLSAVIGWPGLYYFALPVLVLCTVGCNRLASWGLQWNRMAGSGKRQRPFAFVFHLLIWLCFVPGLLFTAFLDYPLTQNYKKALRAQLEPALAYVKTYALEHGRGPELPELAKRFPDQPLGIRYCPDGNILVFLSHHPTKEIHKYLNADLRRGLWANIDADEIERYRDRTKRPEPIDRWLQCALDFPAKPFTLKEQP